MMASMDGMQKHALASYGPLAMPRAAELSSVFLLAKVLESPKQPEQRSVAEQELANLKEYTKILLFEKLVTTGKHETIAIPLHILVHWFFHTPANDIQIFNPKRDNADFPREKNKPRLAKDDRIPLRMLKIDLSKDYYKVVGVQRHVSQSAIWKGFGSRWALFSPRSVDGSKKWHNGPEKRRTVFEQWYTTCTAYLILSTPKLKAQYDIERLVFLDEEAKRKASPMGFVVEMQLAYRIVHNVN